MDKLDPHLNVGVPQADPRQQIKADLERQIDAFLNRGKTIEDVPSGASKDAPFYGSNARIDKLRAKRDDAAPAVRELAAKGIAAKGIAKELRPNASTVARILKENGITQPGPPCAESTTRCASAADSNGIQRGNPWRRQQQRNAPGITASVSTWCAAGQFIAVSDSSAV